MEFYQAAVLCGTVLLIVVLASRANVAFFLSLLLGALLFAVLARMTLPSIGESFSLGFAQTIDSFGLFIIAGCAAACFLERSGISGPRVRHADAAAVAVGLLASLTPSATAALALLRPWCRVVGGTTARMRARTVTTLALALSAGQAFTYPSIYIVATRAILKAELLPVLAIGLTLAVVTAVSGWLFVMWMTPRVVQETAKVSPKDMRRPAMSARAGHSLTSADWRHIIVPTLVPLLFLIAATFAQIPSEPFGRGFKEFFVFMARPTIVLTLSLGLGLLMLKRWDKKVVADSGWLGAALTASARPLLTVGAAGGFVSVLQATGMAELVAERITFLHLGILIPFLAATALKILQGSPLVATLTAAGLVEPLLTVLGLGGAWGHALAACAIGAGTLIVHVNDPYFWLVADMAELTPARALALYTLTTLVQAASAALLLMLFHALLI
jgi:gluconate:H+ symporter, GntP family